MWNEKKILLVIRISINLEVMLNLINALKRENLLVKLEIVH